jgi:hypothetical protein
MHSTKVPSFASLRLRNPKYGYFLFSEQRQSWLKKKFFFFKKKKKERKKTNKEVILFLRGRSTHCVDPAEWTLFLLDLDIHKVAQVCDAVVQRLAVEPS